MAATKKQSDIIAQLKVKIEHLEREKRLQNERHTELILEMAELKKYGGQPGSGQESMAADEPADNLEIDEIMAKLEQDNKFLEEIEEKRRRAEKSGGSSGSTPPGGGGGQISASSSAGSSPPTTSSATTEHSSKSGATPASSTASSSSSKQESGGSSPLHRTGSAITADSGFLSQSSLNGGGAGIHGTSPNSKIVGNGELIRCMSSSPAHGKKIYIILGMSQSSGSLHRLPGLSKAEKIGLMSAGSAGSLSHAGGKGDSDAAPLPAQNEEGMIDIPGKGWTYVFIAR